MADCAHRRHQCSQREPPRSASPGFDVISHPVAPEELLERIEDLEATVARQAAAFQQLQCAHSSLQTAHERQLCTSNDMFAQVSALLGATKSLTEKFQSLEARHFGAMQRELHSHRDEWLALAQHQNRDLEEQVRRLLANFRTEIVAAGRETAVRQGDMAAQLDALADRLSRNAEVQAAVRADHERLTKVAAEAAERLALFSSGTTQRLDDLDRTVTRTFDTTAAATAELRAELQRGHTAAQQMLALCREEVARNAEDGRKFASQAVETAIDELAGSVDRQLNALLAHVDSTAAKLGTAAAEATAAVARELQARTADGDARLANATARLDDLRATAAQHTATAQRALGALEADVKALRHDVQARDTGAEQRLGVQVAELQRAVQAAQERATEAQTLAHSTASTLQLVSSSHDGEAKAAAAAREAADTKLSVFEAAIGKTVADFKAHHSEELASALRRVEQDADRRHQRLVQTTHAAIEQLSGRNTDADAKTTDAVLALRKELGDLQATLDRHSGAIDALGFGDSVEGPFTEIKEWIRDVERRVMTRTEVEEAVLAVGRQLNGFRHTTESAELALGQRIDSERNAREQDAAQLRAQLQKLQVSLRTDRS